jgi:hypothetical protein
MKMIVFTFVLIATYACQKDTYPANPPNPPVPYNGDTTVLDTAINLIGQSWVITEYRIGELGNMIQISDTINFIDQQNYTYGQIQSSYNFYTVSSSYCLTLNDTPWGNISGSIYTYNLQQGIISGLKFQDITTGSSNGSFYYLWMQRI